MPRYGFHCGTCGFVGDLYLKVEGRDDWTPCPRCRGRMDRQFTPTTQIRIPTEFGMKRGWHLPPKDSPRWEGMVREGSEKSQVKETSFKEFLETESA